jgi:dUTP pyrophosphatase
MKTEKISALIHRIDPQLPLPKYETPGSFGFDLLARKTVEIKPQSLALIPSNLIVACPENLALLILPRSSTFKKTGLIFPHSIGLIDRDYHGPEDEILIQVYNLSEENIVIARGQKIAQACFVQMPLVKLSEVGLNKMRCDSRGGFGSTDMMDKKSQKNSFKTDEFKEK